MLHPHLIFKIPLAPSANPDAVSDKLRDVGLVPVSIEPDRAVIAFRDDGDLSSFKNAIKLYIEGPRTEINRTTGQPFKTTKWDVFEYIAPEGMCLWSKSDRIGRRLSEIIGSDGEKIQIGTSYTLDVEMWHRGTDDLARTSLQELRDFLQNVNSPSSRIHDTFTGESLCLARITVSGSTLSDLLQLQIIAELELPPIPTLSSGEVRNSVADDFIVPVPPTDGPMLCIIDSGIASAHPLLTGHIVGAAAEMTATVTASDVHGHGTRVGGIAIFGDVHRAYQSKAFLSPVRLFSVRVLNDANNFDNERLVINQIEAAIKRFYDPPHNCRIFNLSIGSTGPAFQGDIERQTTWGEAIDVLAKKLKVLIVVSAGNFNEIFSLTTKDAEDLLTFHPNHLLAQSARLCDPSTAAIAVSVGSIAKDAIPAMKSGIGAQDIVRAIAEVNHPSPFTRLGHGVNGAIKPEFIEYGGNAVFAGTANTRRIKKDDGTSIMSMSHRPLENLFSFDVGTSYAAPLVTRTAALIWHEVANILGKQPHPNLIRALMASAARMPREIAQLFSRHPDTMFRMAGYGQIEASDAITSRDSRVTMIAEGTIALDTFSLYAVPISEEFLAAKGKKRIRVALAFDPPVRRRRIEYLGVQMNFQMIRGKEADEVIAAFEAAGKEEEEIDGAIQSPYNIPFEPKGRPRNGKYRRNTSTLQLGEFEFTQDKGYGGTYWLLVRAIRRWAPESIQTQDFAIAVTLEADSPQLYASVEARLRQTSRIRPRARVQ